MSLSKLHLILLLALYATASESNCNKGCLRCVSSSSNRRLQEVTSDLLESPRVLQSGEYECQICDLATQYALNGSKCRKLSLSGCVVISPDAETCLLCEKDLVFNNDFGKCLDVPTTKKVTNCEYYDLDLKCVKCAADHFYNSSSNACSAVSTKTTGCVFYSNSTDCAACQEGYILQRNSDKKLVCVNPSAPVSDSDSDSAGDATDTSTDDGSSTEETVKLEPQSCLRKSPYKCSECKAGFFLDYNYRFKMDLSSQDRQLDLVVGDLKSKLGIISPVILKPIGQDLSVQTMLEDSSFGDYKPCVEGLVKNCQVFEDFSTCKVCSDGFYLSSPEKCIEQPVPPISNCSVYISQDVCSVCMNGFYLGNNGTECLEVTQIEGCESYQGTTNKCAKCSDTTKFVNEVENSCKDRTNVDIERCSSYSATSDECLTCESNYFLSSSKIACLAIPENCETYSQVGDALNCTACKALYYLDGTACTQGTVQNCAIYKQTEANACEKCNFNYYINSSGTCTNFSSSMDSNCSETGNTDNECAKCKGSYFAVTRPNRCIQLQNSNTSIGCASLNSDGTCVECKDNYFGTDCQFENTDSTIGCKKFENNSNDVLQSNCLICNQDSHYLDSKKCHKRHNLSLKNCSISQMDTNECQLCNTDSAPRHAQKITTCVDSNDLTASSDVLDKCEIYDVDNSKCSVCKSSYALDGDNGCVETCPTEKLMAQGLYEEVEGEHIFVGNRCVDIPFNLTNCKNIVVQPPNTLICSECNDGYLPSYNTFTGSSTGDVAIHNYDSSSSTFKGASTFTNFGCVDSTLPIASNNSGTELFSKDDCELFNSNNGHLYCSRCKDGKTGIVVKDKFSNPTMSNCTGNTNIYNTTEFYESISFALNTRANPVLDQSLDSLFSIHKCVDTNKIVFLAAKLNISTNSKLLLDVSDVSATPALLSTTESLNYSLVCDDKSSLGSSDLDNCALGVLDIENTTDQRHYCVACEPGYRADKFNLNGVYISKCVAIEGCSSTSSKKANICETCSSGVWRYSNSSAQVMFDYCGVTSISNCLISDSISDSKCSVCNKGYFLTLDKTQCLSQSEENCDVKGSDFLFGIDTSLSPITFSRTLAFLSSLLGSKRGCETCKSGFTKIIYNKFLCEKNINLITHTISNCTKPMVDSGNLSCIECATGFIPRYNSKDCIAATVDSTYTNCSLLEESTTKFKEGDNTPIYPCKVCNPTHIFNESNECSLTKINNCETQDLENGKCLKCNENYVLSYEECVEVPNDSLCIKFDNKGNCLQCKTDYELVIIPEDGSTSEVNVKTECVITNYPNHCNPGSNKISYNNASKSFVEECGECLNGYTLVTKDGSEYGDSYSKCYPVPYPDSNCTEYDEVYLQCSICKANYYLVTKNMVKSCEAVDEVDNCASYVQNANTCASCDEGFFLNLSKECEKNPAGIQNCLQYKTETECLICQKNYYLSDGKCNKVEDGNLITKCDAYASATTCETCEANHLPHNSASECAAITENSCLTWEDIANCKTCADDKMLKTEDGNKKCVNIDIEFCAKVDPSSLKCSECDSGYYLNSDACAAVTTTINNCKVYKDAEKCERCQDNYLVNLTQTECVAMSSIVNFPVADCLTGNEYITSVEGETNPEVCHQCSQGYWNKDGECEQACSDKYCRFCSQSNKSSCDLCVSGFYMEASGKCLPNEGELEEEDSNDDDDNQNVSILSTFILMGMMILFKW